MESLSKELIYLIWASSLALISFILVDRERYRKLFIYGLIGGFLAASIVIGLMRATGGFHYRFMGPLHYKGIPILIPVAWIPAFVLFLHFLPRLNSWEYWLYLIAWVAMSAMIEESLELVGLFVKGWFSEPMRIVLSLIWFYVISQWYVRREGKD